MLRFFRTMSPITRSTVVVSLVALAGLVSAAAGQSERAPTRVEQTPDAYLLLQLAGDATEVRYVPGSLDRAANVQTRLELAMRAFKKWTDVELRPLVFVLSREEWQRTGYSTAYGLPIRVGNGLVVPAFGDDRTVAMWSELLGVLPAIPGTPIRGTPEQLATMLLADIVVQLQASEMLIEAAGLGGNQPWVRGLATHVISLGLVERLEPGRRAALDALYRLVEERHGGSRSARDYTAELELADWLWFQAQFHAGAGIILDQAGSGNDAVKRLRKIAKRDGELSDERLFARFDELRDWYRSRFSAISLRSSSP